MFTSEIEYVTRRKNSGRELCARQNKVSSPASFSGTLYKVH